MNLHSSFEPAGNASRLRRPLGGRLRTYRPKESGAGERLDGIRRALVRGELVLNGFNRWCLRPTGKAAMGWTFVEPGETAAVAATEIRIARRESGNIKVIAADESSAKEAIDRIENNRERPELLVAARDWVLHPSPVQMFELMLQTARTRGLVVHVIATLGTSSAAEDELFQDAEWRRLIDQSPLLRPITRRSNVERRFGESLVKAGLNPIPQKSVAQYFLDYAITGLTEDGPVRLDIEVDGRFWHEEMPGRRRIEDEHRDWVLRRLGWRPVRFWADDVERDEAKCIGRIRREIASPTPATDHDGTMEETE